MMQIQNDLIITFEVLVTILMFTFFISCKCVSFPFLKPNFSATTGNAMYINKNSSEQHNIRIFISYVQSVQRLDCSTGRLFSRWLNVRKASNVLWFHS